MTPAGTTTSVEVAGATDRPDLGERSPRGRRAGIGFRWPRPGRAFSIGIGLFAGYLVLSIGLWWHVWSGHPTSTYLCACGDPGQYLWFFAAPADALRHLHLPFFSGADYHPGGVNMLDNPGVLGLAIAAAPITWAFGPVAAVNVVLTLTPACSAIAAYVLLRRWVQWWPAAAIGGLFYGFSPLVMASLEYVHLQVAFLAVPPLVVLCLDEILVRQRRSPVMVGSALAVLVAVQYLVSPEMLVITALGAGIAVVILAAYGTRRSPDVVRRHLSNAVVGIGVTAGLSLVLLGYPLWFTLDGPRHTVGAPWSFIAATGNAIKEFFVPGRSAYRQALDPVVYGYSGQPGPGTGYLGITVIAATVVAVIALWYDGLVRLAAVVAVIVAILSLGTVLVVSPAIALNAHRHLATRWWLPWTIFSHVPLVDEASPSRTSAVIDLLVAVIGAVGLDRLVAMLATRRPGRRQTLFPPKAVGLAVAAAVLVPVGTAFRVPFRTQSVAPPRWYTTTAEHLPAGSVVLALPWGLSETSAWQAMTGMRFVMAGGDAFVPGPGGRVVDTPSRHSVDGILTDLSTFTRAPRTTPQALRTVRQAMLRWGVTTVAVSGTTGPPTSAVAFMTAVLGTLPARQGSVWVWSNVRHSPPPLAVPGSAEITCLPLTATPLSAARCMLATAATHQPAPPVS